MILSYSKEKFKADILRKVKIHSLREDKHNRWKIGMKIQHWMHSPRNPSKNPHEFGEDICTGKEKVEIWKSGKDVFVAVNGRMLAYQEVLLLAQNDGLTVDQFRLWFVPPGKKRWKGYIIHWTEKRYA